MFKRTTITPTRRRSTFLAPALADAQHPEVQHDDVQHAVDRALAAPAPATTPIDLSTWTGETIVEAVATPAELATGLIELPPAAVMMPAPSNRADAALDATRPVGPKHRADRVRNRRPSRSRYSLAS